MTRAAFRIQYPAFSVVEDAVLDAFLAEQLLRLDPTIYGNRLDAAHGALTAHELFISPAGLSLRTESDGTDTSDYWTKFVKIRREVSPKFALVC